MNFIIRILSVFKIKIKNKTILDYFIWHCNSLKDCENIYNITSLELRNEKMKATFGIFIFLELFECTSIGDFLRLSNRSKLYPEYRKIVINTWKKFAKIKTQIQTKW